MAISTHTLIWLFPVAFMFHDFEELVFLELWLKKNGDDIRRRVPTFLIPHLDAMTLRSTGPLATAVCLAFSLTVLASFLALEHQSYGFILLASGMFFVHGFGHLFQMIMLRRYVPGVITSFLVVIPYGLLLFARLMSDGTVGWPGLVAYCFAGAILFLPFVVTILKLGDLLYASAARMLVIFR